MGNTNGVGTKYLTRLSCIAHFVGWTKFPALDFVAEKTATKHSPKTLPHIAALSVKLMSVSEILEQIDEAFMGIKCPETSLRQYFLTDQKGMSGRITKEEWADARKNRVDTQWQDIPDSEIEECDCLLAHMQAPEYQYYLPAYMRYSINHYQNPDWGNGILGSTVFAIYPSKKDKSMYEYSLSQISLLNSAQNKAIISFLEFISENADYVERPDALKALERYWYEL